MGLSIVKGFVEAQGAQIKAENRAGGGALFTIREKLETEPARPRLIVTDPGVGYRLLEEYKAGP